MPIRSKSFRDVNLSFKRHPITNDLVVLRNEDAIKRSVHNIVFTIIGEKPFRRDFGTVVNQSLFELDTSLNLIAIEKQITSSLTRFEPRIKLNDVKVVVDGSHNAMTAKITYSIIGLMSPIQIVDVLLLPARV